MPTDAPEIVVEDIPELEHGARSLAIAPDGALYVNIGAPSNACERDYPGRDFRGDDPCRELSRSGGVWRFPNVLDRIVTPQRPNSALRYATGLRHTVALAVDPANGAVYGAPHGIDHLHAWWPASGFTDRDAAATPSEALFRIEAGRDYGFPYCMYDPVARRMILTPGYGGHRGDPRPAPRCAAVPAALALFPAHAAPLALVIYRRAQFPPRYQGGIFVALHGSLFRSPLAPSGYEVAFIARGARGGLGVPERFAIASRKGRVLHGRMRPSGLAVGGDGSLFVADDASGQIWRIRARTAAPR